MKGNFLWTFLRYLWNSVKTNFISCFRLKYISPPQWIRFHESESHWQNGSKFFSSLSSHSKPIKPDNIWYCLKTKSHLATFRPRVPREISKRILWVTQDEINFYSSAHYDINIRLFRSPNFGMNFYLDSPSSDSTFSLFDQRRNDTIEEDRVQLISCCRMANIA